jgi:hypothetical protein
MINSCNSKGQYIQVEPIYNLPTHYGSRATLQYIKPTPELYSKHKLLLLKNTYVTNGPGTTYFNPTKQQSFRLQKDSVQYKNKIYKIPCRFLQFIDLIQILLNEGKSIQSILDDISVKYNIQNLSLNNSTYQLKNFYKYSYVNVDAPKVDANTISNPAPFKIGENLASINLQPIVNDIVVIPPAFVTAQYASSIFVSNNKNNTYTNKFEDLLPNGSASFFGALLLNNNLQNATNFNVYGFVIPQYTTQYKSYGYIVDSTNYNIPNLTGLIYIPVQTYASLITFQAYPKNMAFMIYFNKTDVLNDTFTDCRFKKYIPFIANQKDTISYEQ